MKPKEVRKRLAWSLRAAMLHLQLGHCPFCKTLEEAMIHLERRTRK